MTHRRFLMSIFIATLLLAVTIPVLAQQTADVCIANGIVARIRDAGPYESVGARAAAIDKAIVEIISNHDTEHPQVSLKQKDGIWTVYAWDTALIAVYPAEAKANNLTPKQLGQVWVNNIRDRLPKATPVSKMANPPKAPAKPPVTEVPAAPQEAAAIPAATGTMTESASLLLVIDALRISRGLTEEEWIDQREQIARNLLNNLTRFITGETAPQATEAPTTAPSEAVVTPTNATAPVAATTPTTSVTPEPEPVTTQEPVAPAPATPTTEEPTTTAPAASTPPTASQTPAANAHANDPGYSRVPQKERIGRKFDVVKDPYFALRSTNPDAYKQVGELLKAARKHFSAGEFDLSEQFADQALTAVGIDPASIK